MQTLSRMSHKSCCISWPVSSKRAWHRPCVGEAQALPDWYFLAYLEDLTSLGAFSVACAGLDCDLPLPGQLGLSMLAW